MKTAPRPIRVDGDVAYVTLTKGYDAIIDAGDVPLVEDRLWRAHVVYRNGGRIAHVYAMCSDYSTGKLRPLYLHRLIAGTPEGFNTDHIDGDGLNNRRANLRDATAGQNACNRRANFNNTSGVKGVCWHKLKSKWNARIMLSGKSHFLGAFDTVEDAAKAYAKASTVLHGGFGRGG